MEEINLTEDIEIQIYPNPTNGLLTINALNDIEQITVYDNYGRLILRENHHSTNIRISLEDQVSGIYFVQVKTEDKLFNYKIILQ